MAEGHIVHKVRPENLNGYMGQSPRPGNFESFWRSRMREADAVPLGYGLSQSREVPSFSGCQMQDLWFSGMAGTRLHAKYIKPVSRRNVPLVLQFHGYPGSSRSWAEQASFAGMGMAVIALDCPGQGGWGYDTGGFRGPTAAGHIVAGLDGPPEELYYVRLYQNVRILCRILRQLDGIDTGRVFANGGSQGGAIALACAALNPELINRAAIQYPFLGDMRLVWELGTDEIAYEGLRYYDRWFDPDGRRREQWFSKLGYIDTKNFAPMVRCPVLFGTGLSDTVCPPKTQCAVYNHLKCPKKRYLFPGRGHEEIQEFDDLLLDFFSRKEAGL